MPYFDRLPSTFGLVIVQVGFVNKLRSLMTQDGLFTRQPVFVENMLTNFGDQQPFAKTIVPMFDSAEDAIIHQIFTDPRRAFSEQGVALLPVKVKPYSNIQPQPAQHYQYQSPSEQIHRIKDAYRGYHDATTDSILRRLHQTVTLNITPVSCEVLQTHPDPNKFFQKWSPNHGLKTLGALEKASATTTRSNVHRP